MTAEQWRTFGLFSMLTFGVAWFVDERLAVGLVGVAAFVVVLRNTGKLPNIPGGGSSGPKG